MLSISDIIFVIGSIGIVYLITRRSGQRHKRFAPIAEYYNGKSSASCEWLLTVNGRLLRLMLAPQNLNYLLLLRWEPRGSEEWYLMPERARPYLMWKWNEAAFEHAGERWVIGAKKIDPAILIRKLMPTFDKYYDLFSRDFAILRVDSDTQVTGKGLKNIVTARFQGLPGNLEKTPALLQPFLDRLPLLVDELSSIP